MRLRARIALFLMGGVFVFFAFFLPGVADDRALHPFAVVITAKPFANFEPHKPDKTRFGRLTFRTGAILSADTGFFGGFSALNIRDKGKTLVAISDTGHWLEATIERAPDGTVRALKKARMAPLRSGYGPRLNPSKYYIDAEGLAISGKTAYVAFEAINAVAAYDFDLKTFSMKPRKIDYPLGIKKLNTNSGIEALTAARPKGRFQGGLILLSERGLRRSADSFGWLFYPKRKEAEGFAFKIARDNKFDLTDAVFLENDDLLILERRFTLAQGAGARIRLVPAQNIRPGATLKGTVIFEAGLSHQIDNMEGISFYRDQDGRAVLALISDDNHSLLQRTLYLEFFLDED